MRGASALGDWLKTNPEAPYPVFVVWMPVLLSDLGPPSTRLLSELDDSRVRRYWDPGLLLSRAVIATARREKILPNGPHESEDIAWDYVAIFDETTRWDDGFPMPSYYDGPVVKVMPDFIRHLPARGDAR